MFSGELMRCEQCKFEQQSHPNVESGWIAAVIDSRKIAVCPACAGLKAPKCTNCQHFYHERYTRCPWCKATRKRKRNKGFGGDRRAHN